MTMCKKLKFLHVGIAKCRHWCYLQRIRVQFYAMEHAQNEPAPKRMKLDQDVIEKEIRNGQQGEEPKEEEGGGAGNCTFIRERDVGITQYIDNSTNGFFGIIKQRYSDFIVHEISSDEKVVKLTSLEAPPDPNQESREKLTSLLSSEEVKQLKELSESGDKGRNVDLRVSNSKEVRTQIHVAIRNEYPLLDSRTIVGDREEDKLITVFLKGRGSRSDWPRLRGDYIKFVLYKENRDTLQAVNTMASMLRVKPSVFQYGGTKDKRAITTQQMTVYRVSPQRLMSLNNANTGLTLGNFEYAKYPLKLGAISGNHFTITLRNVESKNQEVEQSCLEDEIKKTLESLAEVGFINYFGMQRFGTSTIPTHHVGRALLHSNWQLAVELILNPRLGDPTDMSAARRHYQETKKISETIQMIPQNRRNSVEMCLLKGLEKYGPSNLLAAINHIPRGSRMMYVHGYQSYIWNKMASYRVKGHGLVPILGDLVYKKSDHRNESELDNNPLVDVETVNDSNINQYTIYDVVLSLPGFTVKYPDNQVGKEYTAALALDDLSSEKLLHRVKDFSLPGGYRHLIIKPKGLEWELVRYSDVTLPLSQSDLEILEGKPPPKNLKEGSKAALKLMFSLPSSTYATMALREILKSETSSHYQSLLNQSNESEDDEEYQE